MRRFNCSHVTKMSVKTFARGYKKRIQLGKTSYRFSDFINRKYFTLILKTIILTALINSVTSTEIFTIQKQPPEVFLKFKWKFHKLHGKTPMPVSLFLIKLQGLGLQLYKKPTPKSIDKLLRCNSQNMKAFKFKI